MQLKKLFSKIINDSQGMLLSTDLMLSMIIITITMGMTAQAMDIVINPMQDYSTRSSMEHSAIEAADVLINTPGSPANWENFNSSLIDSPGLAMVNPLNGEPIPHVLSYKKILLLNKNYDKLMENRVFPEYIGSNIIIYPLNHTLDPIIINDDALPAKTAEIVVVNRTVMCDYQYLNCTLQINSSNENFSSSINQEEICPNEIHTPDSNLINNSNHPDPAKSDKWICKHFNINASTLNTTDYYLIVQDTGAGDGKKGWILDRPEMIIEQETRFSSSPLKLNDQIGQLIGNEKQNVLWLHVKCSDDPEKSFNTYIVAVPKNTDTKYVKTVYLNPQPCYFILKVWLK
jgi:hypothetical protein